MKGWFLILWITLTATTGCGPHVATEDRERFEACMQYARTGELDSLARAERVAKVGMFFAGTPYEGGTLDGEGEERLVVNLRAFDCVTFVDNVLAISMLDSYQGNDMQPFLQALQKVRYRAGRIEGYTSRLHYSTDWLHEMEKGGIVRDITPELGGIPFIKPVDFLSRQMQTKGDTLLYREMKHVETAINARKRVYLPKEKVTEEVCKHIQDGDILLFTTNRPGLDTGHVGIAKRVDGEVHLLHASSSEKRVTVTPGNLVDYLREVPAHSGIIIARII